MKKLQIHSSDFVRRLLAAWLLMSGALYWQRPWELTGISALNNQSFSALCVGTGILYLVFNILSCLIDSSTWERWLIPVAFGILWGRSLFCSWTLSYFLAGSVILVLAVAYACLGQRLDTKEQNPLPSHPIWPLVTFLTAVGFFLLVSAWTVGRVKTYSSPTYDFGIFSQMFYSMKETGLPDTTLERDGLLSHFQVHVSPAYYLLLPLYGIFPQPEALQIFQAAILATSVIPLWKLARNYGFGGAASLGICLLLLSFPAYAGGTGYDIHENAFLPPALLWLFYGIDRKNCWLTAAAAILTLGIKEDAAVYVAVLGLWLCMQSLTGVKKDPASLLTGIFLMGVAILWFLWVTNYLQKSGQGVMTYRYSNLIYDGSGSLLTVMKAVLLCPIKALFECVDTQKLSFLGFSLPLLCLGLITRRYERLILLIPFLLINLMSDYRYQHDIFFQYTFGSTACLIYLAVRNLADLRPFRVRGWVLATALALSCTLFTYKVLPKALYYPRLYQAYHAYYDGISQALQTVPQNASVTASTFYTAPLSQRAVIYDVDYASRDHMLSSEYIVINPSAAFSKYGGFDALHSMLIQEGYTLELEYGSALKIYRRSGS